MTINRVVERAFEQAKQRYLDGRVFVPMTAAGIATAVSEGKLIDQGDGRVYYVTDHDEEGLWAYCGYFVVPTAELPLFLSLIPRDCVCRPLLPLA